jgi:hypothetical protein
MDVAAWLQDLGLICSSRRGRIRAQLVICEVCSETSRHFAKCAPRQQDKKGYYLTCFPGDCNDPTSIGEASITWIRSAGKSRSSWVMSAKVGLADFHSLKGGA